MDNLTQILTEALVNANKNGSKINLDDVIKEVIRTEVEKTVNEILGHELTAFLGYEKVSKVHQKNVAIRGMDFIHVD